MVRRWRRCGFTAFLITPLLEKIVCLSFKASTGSGILQFFLIMSVWAAIAKKHLTFLRFIPEVWGGVKQPTICHLFKLFCRFEFPNGKKKKIPLPLTDRNLTHCTFKGLYRPVAFRQFRKTQIKTL